MLKRRAHNINSYFSAILLLAFLCLLSIKGISQDSLSIVVFGNSTSAPRKNIQQIYPLRLMDSLTKIGMPAKLKISAIPGSHSGSFNDNHFHKIQHGKDRFEKDVLNQHPNWTIISFGINDAWQDNGVDSTERIPLAQYIANLNYYIETLKINNSNIILLAPNPIGNKYEGWRFEKLKKYADATKALAKEKKVYYVDVWDRFVSHSLSHQKSIDSLLLDGMHPNDQGHEIIANAIFEIISQHEIWVAPKAIRIPHLKMGPFVRLNTQEIITVDSTNSFISKDDGISWTSYPLFNDPKKFLIRDERALILTKSGTLILAFVNEKEKANWNWNSETHDAPDAILPTYTIRSVDGGKTWIDLQKLHKDWTGAIRDIIETRDGTIVFTSMMMRHNPGHHTVLTYSSNDEGKNWTRSNIIDLGGIGHHAGVTESTLTPLEDGRLWMLMRTNYGKFWEIFSSNNGLLWTDIRASNIDASSAPGMLKKLSSGKLVLIWNRQYPEGKSSYPVKGGDNQWSDIPVSNHREALSIQFSEDDGKTWSEPKVLAKTYSSNAQIAYPYVFEHSPGLLWITTMYGGLRIRVNENDFFEKKLAIDSNFGMRLRVKPTNSNAIQAPSILAHGASNESTMIQFPSGLIKIYFINRPGNANKLMSISSTDGGIHWTNAIKEFDLPGEAYYANQLLLDKQGTLHAIFHIYGTGNNGYRGKHLDLWYSKQTLNKTWEPAKKIFDGYVGSIRGFIQLKNNRLLIPMSEADPATAKKPQQGSKDYGLFHVICLISDDLGDNWKKSQDQIKIEVDPNQVTRYGAVEPTAIELKNGTIWMLIRTNKGCLFESYSADGGEHWSIATPSGFISSDSPGSLLRLKEDSIVLLWSSNQRYDNIKSYANGGREVLHAAISVDEGKNWEGFKEVLVSPFSTSIKGDHGTAYPSAVQNKDGKIIFIAGQGEERSIVGFDPKWLFQNTQIDKFENGLSQWTHFGITDIQIKKSDDKNCLYIPNSDTSIKDAVWNFPMLKKGNLEIQLSLSHISSVLHLALSNHFSISTDQLANKNAGINFDLHSLTSIKAGRILKLTLHWNTITKNCQLLYNGKVIEEKKIDTFKVNGFNYLRIGLNNTQDTSAFLQIHSVSVQP